MNIQELLQDALERGNNRSAVDILSTAQKDTSINLDEITKIRLSYVRMASLSAKQLIDLMSKSILQAYTLPDFWLSEKIENYAELMFDPEAEVYLYDQIGYLLSSNNEPVTTQNITVNNKVTSPTISNWIIDYLSMFLEQDRDALTQLKYVNTSTNTKDLSEVQRAVIKDLLKLYDKAESMVVMWESLPSDIDIKDAQAVFDMKNYYPGIESTDGREVDTTGMKVVVSDSLPDIEDELEPKQQVQEIPIKTTPVQPVKPILTQPNPVVVHKPEPAIPKPVVKPILPIAGIKQQPKTVSLDLNNPKKINLGSTDIDAKINKLKGIVHDGHTNVKVADEVERLKKDQDKFSEIEAKLKQLKSKQTNQP